jgi:hypothetical protein
MRMGQALAPAGRPKEGGRSAGADPKRVFGVAPISNSSVPPAASSAWLIQLLLHGWPFHFTDWM